MKNLKLTFRNLWLDDSGQDVAEYALMLAVILVVVAGTVAAIGTNANNIFTKAGDAINK
jgi:Flp pilus assembly pilin Flp